MFQPAADIDLADAELDRRAEIARCDRRGAVKNERHRQSPASARSRSRSSRTIAPAVKVDLPNIDGERINAGRRDEARRLGGIGETWFARPLGIEIAADAGKRRKFGLDRRAAGMGQRDEAADRCDLCRGASAHRR